MFVAEVGFRPTDTQVLYQQTSLPSLYKRILKVVIFHGLKRKSLSYRLKRKVE